MDIETQKRYAGAMQKLINEVSLALDADITQYVYDQNHDTYQTVTIEDATDDTIERFVAAGSENIGSLGAGYAGADLTDFFKWLMGEVFNQTSGKNNPYSIYDRNDDVRDLSTMTDDQFKDWLKEERETRQKCEKAKSGDVMKSMLGLIYGSN